MATITIPVEGRGGNPVRVMINGVEYVIPRGVETTVSDAVAAELAKLDMALITGNGYPDDPRALPLVTDEDAGKILRVGEDGKWAAAAPELPAVDGDDNGKVLTVVSGAWAAAAVPTELPEVETTDEGKVLTVSDEGEWVAAAVPAELPEVPGGGVS